jgi:hypothetical protein
VREVAIHHSHSKVRALAFYEHIALQYASLHAFNVFSEGHACQTHEVCDRVIPERCA